MLQARARSAKVTDREGTKLLLEPPRPIAASCAYLISVAGRGRYAGRDYERLPEAAQEAFAFICVAMRAA